MLIILMGSFAILTMYAIILFEVLDDCAKKITSKLEAFMFLSLITLIAALGMIAIWL